MCAVAFSSLVWSQDYRATLIGQVSDPSGAAIPNATVRAIRVDTNQVTEVQTTTNGMYTIPFLNPATYTVEVSATGFKSFKRETSSSRQPTSANFRYNFKSEPSPKR